MSIKKYLAALGLVVALTGCATPPQNPITFNSASFSKDSGRIGVAMTTLPKVDTYFPGAGCLLCIAAASVANAQLTKHSQTLPYEDIPQLKDLVAEALRKKGASAVVIPDELQLTTLPDAGVSGPNVAKKDFSSFKKKYGIDKLLVIDISMLGVIRTYSSYIPTSDPKSILEGKGFIVNLNNNTYEWYQPVNVTKSADGKWDEPPKFPGLTNAYFQALEIGKDAFLKSFN